MAGDCVGALAHEVPTTLVWDAFTTSLATFSCVRDDIVKHRSTFVRRCGFFVPPAGKPTGDSSARRECWGSALRKRSRCCARRRNGSMRTSGQPMRPVRGSSVKPRRYWGVAVPRRWLVVTGNGSAHSS